MWSPSHRSRPLKNKPPKLLSYLPVLPAYKCIALMWKCNVELIVDLNNSNKTNTSLYKGVSLKQMNKTWIFGLGLRLYAHIHLLLPVRIPSAVTVTSHQQRNRNYASECIRLMLLFCHYKAHKGSFSSASRHWDSIHACFQGNSIEYPICPCFVWNEGLAENDGEKSMILCKITPTHSLPLYPGCICLLLF